MGRHLREYEISKIPFIMFSCYLDGEDEFEDSDTGTQWRVCGNGGFNIAIG